MWICVMSKMSAEKAFCWFFQLTVRGLETPKSAFKSVFFKSYFDLAHQPSASLNWACEASRRESVFWAGEWRKGAKTRMSRQTLTLLCCLFQFRSSICLPGSGSLAVSDVRNGQIRRNLDFLITELQTKFDLMHISKEKIRSIKPSNGGSHFITELFGDLTI